MAGFGGSKNNPENRGSKVNKKLAISSDCESCTEQCQRGIVYLERMKKKGTGFGVPCNKK